MSYISAHTMLKPELAKPSKLASDPVLTDRLVRRFFGLVFGFASIGLWLVPSANETADVLLLKTGFTAILCFCSIIALLPRLKD